MYVINFYIIKDFLSVLHGRIRETPKKWIVQWGGFPPLRRSRFNSYVEELLAKFQSRIHFDPSRHHGAGRTLLRLGELRGMTQIASFANARRYIHSSQHHNFRRYSHCYERNEFPVQQQPDAVLRRHLSEFMQVVPLPVRRRCRVAIPLTASDDAA